MRLTADSFRRMASQSAAREFYDGLSAPEQQVFRDCVTDAAYNLLNSVEFRILLDCKAAGMTPEDAGAYRTAVMTYLALATSNWTARSTSLVSWENQHGKPRYTFTRQAIQMVWDYAEVNPFGSSGFMRCIDQLADALERLPAGGQGVR